MNTIALIAAAAVTLGHGAPPLAGTDGTWTRRSTPDLILAAGKDTVVADFGVVEYYPTLKSKLGLSSNIKRTELIDAVPFAEDLGPGLVCSNIEFDYWYKWPGTELPALTQTFEVPGDPTSRPVALSPTPGKWLTQYEQMLGDLNIGLLMQLTGAPAQYQSPMPPTDVHLAPTDPVAAADLMASWTSGAKHPYPVHWSLWNEPGHTLGAVESSEEVAATVGKKDGNKAERKAAKEAAKIARNSTKAGKKAVAAERSDHAQTIADLFQVYSLAMRPTIDRWSQFGLASFINADFNPKRASDNGRVFFDEVMEALDPSLPVDFLTFNSFNGAWPVILNGARAVTGAQNTKGMLIFTQFAPPSMKFNSDGSFTKESSIDSTLMQVSLDMIDDFVQMQRATDVQHVCMAYWVGGNFGLLDAGGNGLKPTSRYHAMKMLMDLPTVRTSLDLGTSGLGARGVEGLAGRSPGKVAVLLWNESDRAVSVPLVLKGVPEAMAGGRMTLTILDDDTPTPVTTDYDGGPVRLSPHGMAMVTQINDAVPDPLQRRSSIRGPSGNAQFLQTRSFTDRAAETCARGLALPDVDGCARNTGTYGFYDSVRSVAYLGMGTGKKPARVTATYSGLPDALYLARDVFSVGAAAPDGAVQVSTRFEACGAEVEAVPSGVEDALWVLDFQSVPDACRAEAATITLSLGGVPAGTQAEVHLGADAAEVRDLAAGAAQLVRASPPDLDEGLEVSKPKRKLN